MRFKYLLLLTVSATILIATYAFLAPSDTTARATLSNGLRVVVVKNKLAPVVTMYVNYLVGADESPPGFPGTAHAVEHMMFRGSPGLSSEQLNTIQANVGDDSNAFTQQTVTQYISTVPASDLETMLHVEACRMRDILSEEERWRIERGAIIQEVAEDLSSPMYVLWTRLLEQLFEGTPYANDPLGTVHSFEKSTGAMLKKFHHDWYAPNNAILVIVGDVEPSRIIRMVKKLFGDIPSKTLPPRAEIHLKPLRPAELKIESDESYGMAVVAYRLPGSRDKDFAAGQVLDAVLASQRSKLYALGNEENFYETDFDSMAFPEGAVGFALAAVPAGENLRQKAELLKKVIADYVSEGIPSELVEAVKRQSETISESNKDSIPGMAEAWSEALANEGLSSPEEGLAAIKRVTVDDVNRVARAYLINDTAITALLMPGKSAKPVVVGKKFKPTKETFTSKSSKPVMLPTWARDVTNSPTIINKRAVPISDMRLSNGLRLIVRTSGNGKLVTLHGSIRNEPVLQTPRGKEGVSDLLDELMLHGTKSMDRVQFETALDDIGASVVPGTDFSLIAMGEHFAEGVALLADALLHPALPDDSFKLIREKTARLAAGKKDSLQWLQERAFMVSLYPKNDPVLRYATPESLKRVTIRDVKEYYATVFRPDLTTIVITGNYDAKKARTIIEKYFAGWHATGPKPETELKPTPDNKPVSMLLFGDNGRQAEVTLAQTLGLTRAHPDYYPFQLGMSILAGTTESRLYQDIREKRGLVYAIDAELRAGKTRSSLEITYGAEPKNVAKVRALIERDIDEIRTKPVSQVELDLARNAMLRQFVLQETSSESVALDLLDLAQNDLPLDEHNLAAKQIEQITADKIRSVLHRWIRPGGFVQITTRPVSSAAKKR